MEENTCQKFRLKNIDETTNYLIEEINQNELISKNHKKAFTFLNCVEHILILCPTIPEYVSISTFYFFGWYSDRNYEFCSRIKNLCNNCSN